MKLECTSCKAYLQGNETLDSITPWFFSFNIVSCKIINICPSSSLIGKEILHCATSSRWSSLIYDLQSWYAILMFCGKKQCIYGRFGLFPEWLQARVQVEVTGRAGTKAKIAHFFKKRRVVFGIYSKQTNHYIPTQPAESILYHPYWLTEEIYHG